MNANLKPHFANFEWDHATMLVDTTIYNVFYLLLRIILCVPADRSGIVYDVLGEQRGDHVESMTYAVKLGGAWTITDEEQFRALEKVLGKDTETPEGFLENFYRYFTQKREADLLRGTLLASVQASEPPDMASHVRQMLAAHSACAHVQHLALKTPDLRAFYDHATARGVQFVTPILYDDKNDLAQVFGGEFSHPWSEATSAFFLEFVERRPNPELRKEGENNREVFFRDKTFLSLYGYKQTEYESGNIVPFISPELFRELYTLVGHKKFWEITEDDVVVAEKIMLEKI